LSRRFNFSGGAFAPVRTNPAHVFALQHALKLYHANGVYTYIPKNACSTLRYSLAIENGFIEGPSQINWIHSNNETFSMRNEDAITSSFAFVILRCPFRRVYSAYMDKIVNMDIQTWALYDGYQRRIHPHNVTFSDFVEMIKIPVLLNLNHHWKPQSAFLLFKEYDVYYAMEEFGECVRDLKKRLDFTVHDARGLTGHSTEDFEKVDGGERYEKMSAFEILRMKKDGKLPSERAVFTDEIINAVSEIYKDDIEIYKSRFGDENLLFS
jgi:hypothetical protein